MPLTAVNPSTYNPRDSDPSRLDLIELSLRKLGWLLPIYADAQGEILSGHQRHMVATRMGCTQIPVETTKPMTLAERKGINVAFNRGTNDMDRSDTTSELQEAMVREDVRDKAAALPDLTVDTPEFFPCMQAKPIAVKDLVRVNSGRWINYALTVAKFLHRRKILLPVVCTPDLQIVNGVGRVQMAAEKKIQTLDVVIISEAQASFARAMLNLLTMDFDIHTRYADLLRHNSFRRATDVRSRLGRGFITQEYYRLKGDHGYSQDQIERKRLSLEGVLVPVASKWNEDFLRAAGYTVVECVWRWMNFAAWLAIKA